MALTLTHKINEAKEPQCIMNHIVAFVFVGFILRKPQAKHQEQKLTSHCISLCGIADPNIKMRIIAQSKIHVYITFTRFWTIRKWQNLKNRLWLNKTLILDIDKQHRKENRSKTLVINVLTHTNLALFHPDQKNKRRIKKSGKANLHDSMLSSVLW